ncbi:MAG: hypothetical protein AB3N18_13355 [Allomuricauda sp.]
MTTRIILYSLLLMNFSLVFSQQRMRIPRGNYKLSTTTRIPANCIDRSALTPQVEDVFGIAANSIFLVGESVQRISLQEGVEKGIIEIIGNGTAKSVDFRLLKPEMGYKELRVTNSSGVLGFTGQNFDDLSRLSELEENIKNLDFKYNELKEKYDEDNLLTEYLKKEIYRIDGMFTDNSYTIAEISLTIDDVIKNIDSNLSKIDAFTNSQKQINQSYESFVLKNGRVYTAYSRKTEADWKIKNLFLNNEIDENTFKDDANRILEFYEKYQSNYEFFNKNEALDNYSNHIRNNYEEGSFVELDFRRKRNEMESSLKGDDTKEKLELKIQDLITSIKKEESLFSRLSDDFLFYNSQTSNEVNLNGKNIIIENIDEFDYKQFYAKTKNPFVFTKDILLDNAERGEEQLKFIFVGSKDPNINKDLYQASSSSQMQSFSNHVNDILNDSELSPHFIFVSSKNELEEALSANKEFRTIMVYHNREDDLLFGEAKYYYDIKERLTCNSLEDGYWGSSIESTTFLDPEDILNSFATLVKENPEKNKFDIIDFYSKFGKKYIDIQHNRSVETKLYVGNAAILVTGTGLTILWSPTGQISGKLEYESNGSIKAKVNLIDFDSYEILATTWTNDNSYSFKDIVVGEYYLDVDTDFEITDGKDFSPDDDDDDYLHEDRYIYVNLEPQEEDNDNNYSINDN